LTLTDNFLNISGSGAQATGRMTSGKAIQSASDISGRLPDDKNNFFEYPVFKQQNQ